MCKCRRLGCRKFLHVIWTPNATIYIVSGIFTEINLFYQSFHPSMSYIRCILDFEITPADLVKLGYDTVRVIRLSCYSRSLAQKVARGFMSLGIALVPTGSCFLVSNAQPPGPWNIMNAPN